MRVARPNSHGETKVKKLRLNEAQLRRLVRGMIAEAGHGYGEEDPYGKVLAAQARMSREEEINYGDPDAEEEARRLELARQSRQQAPVARTRYEDPTLAKNVHSPDLDRRIGVMLGMKHFTRDASIEFRDVIMATKDAVKRGESEYADKLAQLVDHGVKTGIVQIKR